MTESQQENRSLWNQLRLGDKTAFERLVLIHYRPLYNYGLRLCSDAELIHDCIQELLLYLWEKREVLPETEYVRTYLLHALRNKVIRENLRLRKLRDVEELAFEQAFEPPIEAKIVETEQYDQMIRQLNAVVNNLSRRQREVIYLRFYQNLSYEDIAGIMELSKQSVANLLHRSMKDIRTGLLPDHLFGLLLMYYWKVHSLTELQ